MTTPAPEAYATAAEDPDTAAQLRVIRRIVMVIAALVVICAAGSTVAFLLAAHEAETLLRTGVYTPGEVVDTWTGAKGSPFIAVDYQVGGVAYRSTVAVSGDMSYAPGQVVTVVADPQDPLRMRTLQEKNTPPALELASIGPLVFAISLSVVAIALGLSNRSLRRRCSAGRWVRVQVAEQRHWRKALGVTLIGDGVHVVVSTSLRYPLTEPLWALSDTAVRGSIVLRSYKWGNPDGPVQIRQVRIWPASRLAAPTLMAPGETPTVG